MREDPQFVFVTGWNEWIAGRFAEFNGVKLLVMFVDQFGQEHSHDIEPMRGGHRDDYYYQLVTYIRRFKGARTLPIAKPKPIVIDGSFSDRSGVEPEFRDTVGDQVDREFRGWDPNVIYRNKSGRHDIVAAKVSWDGERIYSMFELASQFRPRVARIGRTCSSTWIVTLTQAGSDTILL